MSAIPIDVDDDEAVDPGELRRQPTAAIPLPGAARGPIAIHAGAIPRLIGQPSRAIDMPEEIPAIASGSAMPPIGGAAPRPSVMSSGGIPVTPKTSRGIIPTDPNTGEAEQVNNKGIPIRAGVAGLWAKADNIHNPVLRVLGKIGAGAARAIDTAAAVALPGLDSRIPGTELNERAQGNRKLAVEQEEAKTAEATARTEKERAETEAIKDKPEPQAKSESPQQGYADAITAALKADVDPAKDPHVQAWANAIKQLQKEPAQQKPDNPEQQFVDEYQKLHPGATIAEAQKAYVANHQAPQHESRQMVVGPDGTVIELKPGMKVPQGSKTMAGDLAGQKPSADEQKRADLVENLNENLDQLEDIVKRRPELFGKIAGRATKFKEWVGSDDPDVAALKGIEDRLGMVQQSSHGMRSAQHVAASADSVINSYKNGPDAMLRSIADARKSGATFTQDVERKTGEKQGGETFTVPKDAPAAPKEDGHKLQKDGKTLAVSKGGKWVAP